MMMNNVYPRISLKPYRSVTSPFQKKIWRSMKSGWKNLAPRRRHTYTMILLKLDLMNTFL